MRFTSFLTAVASAALLALAPAAMADSTKPHAGVAYARSQVASALAGSNLPTPSWSKTLDGNANALREDYVVGSHQFTVLSTPPGTTPQTSNRFYQVSLFQDVASTPVWQAEGEQRKFLANCAITPDRAIGHNTKMRQTYVLFCGKTKRDPSKAIAMVMTIGWTQRGDIIMVSEQWLAPATSSSAALADMLSAKGFKTVTRPYAAALIR